VSSFVRLSSLQSRESRRTVGERTPGGGSGLKFPAVCLSLVMLVCWEVFFISLVKAGRHGDMYLASTVNC